MLRSRQTQIFSCQTLRREGENEEEAEREAIKKRCEEFLEDSIQVS